MIRMGTRVKFNAVGFDLPWLEGVVYGRVPDDEGREQRYCVWLDHAVVLWGERHLIVVVPESVLVESSDVSSDRS